jgi:hypothetical protein
MLHVRIIKPSQMWGGDEGTETDSEAVVDSILSREAETQSAEDQDWDSTDTETGDQAKSKTSEGEEGEADETDQDAADDEQDSEEESEEEESEESTDDEFQLPAKQAKSYDDKTLTHFAKRLGATLEQVKGNPPLMKAVKSLIDNAIHVRDLTAEADTEDGTDEKVEDDSKTQAKTEEEKPLSPEQEEEAFKQHRSRLSAFVKNPNINDPRMVTAYKKEQAAAWGIDLSLPGAEAKLKAKGIDLDAMVESQMSFMVNAFNTLLPQFLPGAMDASHPGFQKMYDNALQSNIWDEIQAQKDFAALPAYGTPDFNTKLQAVLKANPWIDQIEMKDAKGKPLGKQALMREKYKIAAGYMVGKKADPEVVAKAVEAGRREQRKVDVTKKAASNLGAGKKSGNFSDGKSKLKGSGGGFVEAYEQSKGGF